MEGRFEKPGPWIAVGGLATVAWITIASAFKISPWALVLLPLLIPEAIAVDMLARAGRKTQTMIVPVVGVVLWFLGIFAGVSWLGWGK